ncbi:serine hydrolase [Pontibacter sp. G13]|uniref:serine hydrolase domain-containing protein n=1 Tax=Pontibacter sp. G13 TaxID=3074898 RepID=UPI00288BD7F5|nr:serine hydrolase [Pontibacter sp. G13]WNJ19363.1 serine hydrolase [Pontibacter sp. G13]
MPLYPLPGKGIVVLVFNLICLHSCSQAQQAFVGYATATVDSAHIQTQTFGYADQAAGISYSDLTVQPVGSVSKTLIGMSLMIAKDQGLIDLDADINDYLDFPVQNPRLKDGAPITLRHLATHTSGIIDTDKNYEQAYSKGKVPEKDLGTYLKDYLLPGGTLYSKKQWSKHTPGTYYEYSNVGAALAAHVLERASGIPFDQFTQRHILTPLGMTHSGWSYASIDESQHAVLYDAAREPIGPYTLITYPDGGFRTCIQDLAIYLQTLIQGYAHQSDLLTPAAWDEWFSMQFTEAKPVQNIDPREPNSGIFMMHAKSGKIGHTGSDPGVSAFMFFNPETLRGQLFMTNLDITEENVEQFKEIWDRLE